MICYFSGTGNSQRVARRLAEACGDTLFSINKSLRLGAVETLHCDKPFVFVTPTYAWRIPRVVERWIGATTFTGSKNAYFVLTCGSECANAAAYAKALCAGKGFAFFGLSGIVMPENYLALFTTPSKAEAELILARAAPHIEAVADLIRQGKPLPAARPGLVDRVMSGPVNPLLYAACISDKGFKAGEGCTGCGLCARRCPLKNISMEGNKPHWNGNCTHCMACIGGCPAEAIEYKRKSKGQPRYYIMKDEV